MEIKELKALTPVKIVLPTRDYPHILGLLDEIEYPCGNCSSAEGRTVFRRLSESYLDPISGPGKYSTRLAVYCPGCKVQCQDHGYIQRGIIDLLSIPKGYKAAKRAEDPRAGGIFGDDEQPLVDASGKSESPEAPMVIPARPQIDPGAGNILVYSVERGWHVIKAKVVETPVEIEKLEKPKPKAKRSPKTAAAKAKATRLKAKTADKPKVV